jgi:deoxyribodipyrimidine photo-lyase
VASNNFGKILLRRKILKGNPAAIVKLQDFFNKKLDNYGKFRDFPAKEVTSGLSKFLNCGLLSPEEILKTALSLNKNGLNWELFLRQLAWRDFYYHLYYHFPCS